MLQGPGLEDVAEEHAGVGQFGNYDADWLGSTDGDGSSVRVEVEDEASDNCADMVKSHGPVMHSKQLRIHHIIGKVPQRVSQHIQIVLTFRRLIQHSPITEIQPQGQTHCNHRVQKRNVLAVEVTVFLGFVLGEESGRTGSHLVVEVAEKGVDGGRDQDGRYPVHLSLVFLRRLHRVAVSILLGDRRNQHSDGHQQRLCAADAVLSAARHQNHPIQQRTKRRQQSNLHPNAPLPELCISLGKQLARRQ